MFRIYLECLGWYLAGALGWTLVRAGLLLSFWDRGTIYQLEVLRRFREWPDFAMQATLWPVSIVAHVDSWVGERESLRDFLKLALHLAYLVGALGCATHYRRPEFALLMFIPWRVESAMALWLVLLCANIGHHSAAVAAIATMLAFQLLLLWREAHRADPANAGDGEQVA